jgi:hypothetical protein
MLFTVPVESVLAAGRQILVGSGRVFRYGNSIVMTKGDGQSGQLVSLWTGCAVEPGAESILANLFVCQLDGGNDDDA